MMLIGCDVMRIGSCYQLYEGNSVDEASDLINAFPDNGDYRTGKVRSIYHRSMC